MTDPDQSHNQKPAQRSRASLIILIVLAFLLMAGAVFLVVSLPDDQAWHLPTADTNKINADETGFTCSVSEAQQLFPFSSGVMKLTSTRVALIDVHGTEQFAYDLEFSAPFAVSNEKFMMAADRDGHSLIMLNNQGKLYQITMAGRISGAALRDDGTLAIVSDIGYEGVVTDQSNSTGVVSIFGTGGNWMFDCYLPDTGYILSVSFPTDSDSFDIALVNTAASAAKPIIKRYSLQGVETGQRIPDLPEIYPLVVYDPAGHPVLCSAANLAAISYDSSALIWQQSYPRILAVRSTPAGLAVAAAKADGQCWLDVLAGDGRQQSSQLIGASITNMDSRGDLLTLGSGTRVVTVNLRTGVKVLDRDVGAEIIRVGFAADNALTVITRTGVLCLASTS